MTFSRGPLKMATFAGGWPKNVDILRGAGTEKFNALFYEIKNIFELKKIRGLKMSTFSGGQGPKNLTLYFTKLRIYLC